MGPTPEPGEKTAERTKGRVLVIDADSEQGNHLAEVLADAGLLIDVAAEVDGILGSQAHQQDGGFDAVVLDAELSKQGWLDRVRELPGAPEVILLASFGCVTEAVQSIRGGAFDYIERPATEERIRLAVRRAVAQHQLALENSRLRASLVERYELGNVVSRDPKLRKVFDVVEAIADTRATVLITGESGTGKSQLARAIHARSSRRSAPFVVVNCGALPPQLLESELFGHARGAFTGAVRDKPGVFEAAHGGTLFLDEIACAPSELQVKLLRVLQDRTLERVGETITREVDVRVICATNQDLRREVDAGRFRADLYYRIHVVALELPALRERPGDVPLLANRFLERLARDYGRTMSGFDRQAMARLIAHPWPGNVRELENTVERALLLATGQEIQAADLGLDAPPASQALNGQPLPSSSITAASAGPPPGKASERHGPILPLKEALMEPERALIVEALRYTGGNRQRAAALLGINRTTLFNKMRKYALLAHRHGGED